MVCLHIMNKTATTMSLWTFCKVYFLYSENHLFIMERKISTDVFTWTMPLQSSIKSTWWCKDLLSFSMSIGCSYNTNSIILFRSGMSAMCPVILCLSQLNFWELVTVLAMSFHESCYKKQEKNYSIIFQRCLSMVYWQTDNILNWIRSLRKRHD